MTGKDLPPRGKTTEPLTQTALQLRPVDPLRQQSGRIDAQHLGQEDQLEVTHPAHLSFDGGDDAAGDVPARHLALGRELFLRPAEAISRFTHLRTNDILW